MRRENYFRRNQYKCQKSTNQSKKEKLGSSSESENKQNSRNSGSCTISKNVNTSHILGTLLNLIFHLTSRVAAKIGNIAFLDQLTIISQDNSLEVFILYIYLNS